MLLFNSEHEAPWWDSFEALVVGRGIWEIWIEMCFDGKFNFHRNMDFVYIFSTVEISNKSESKFLICTFICQLGLFLKWIIYAADLLFFF